MPERKLYIESLYGSTAMARTKEEAWTLLCAKCECGNLKPPRIEQVIEESDSQISEHEDFV